MVNKNTNKRLSKEHFDNLSKIYGQVYQDPNHGQHFEFAMRTQITNEELKRYLSNNLPYKKKFSFLDAACGTGELTFELIKSAMKGEKEDALVKQMKAIVPEYKSLNSSYTSLDK